MNVTVRKYEEKDLPDLIRIWNEVVEDGVAFPQEECLNEETGKAFFAEQISRFCSERGLFPSVDYYREQEHFFEAARRTPPANAVIALPGVDGLNAAEHLRALLPETRVIWCSDLDFSLHAFRLRVDYFLLEPVTSDAFRQGLCVWFGETMPSARNGADSEE